MICLFLIRLFSSGAGVSDFQIGISGRCRVLYRYRFEV